MREKTVYTNTCHKPSGWYCLVTAALHLNYLSQVLYAWLHIHLITKSWRYTSKGLLHRLTYAGTVPVIDGGKLGTDIAWGASLSRKTVAVTGMVSCQVRIWAMLGDCLWALLCTSVPTNMSFPLVNVVICVYYLWRPKQAKQGSQH